MKLSRYFGMATLAFSLVTGSAFAHHHDLGTAGALDESAQELQQAVQFSALSYNVKNAVYYFALAASQLNSCVPPEPEPGPGPNAGSWHHHEIPPQCQGYLQHVREHFYQVDYYLSDATDYPQVYQAYQEAKEALYAIEG